MQGDLLGQLEQQGEDHLHDRGGAVGRHVGDDDILCPGRFEINDVIAGRQYADILQAGRVVDNLGIEHAFVGQHDLGVADPGEDIFRFGPVVDLAFAERSQRLHLEVARIHGKSIEYDNLHFLLRKSLFS